MDVVDWALDRRSNRALAVGLTIGLALSACGGPEAAGGQSAAVVVDRVVDGDTVELDFGGRVEAVRLVGIDAPESVSLSVPVQCFGAEASAALGQVLPAGTEVAVQRDVEGRDHYGRLLLYLHRVDDGLFVNRWMVEQGYADATSYDPNTFHQADFERAERAARSAGRGLWGRCDGPDQPLDP